MASIREEVAASGDPRVGSCKLCAWLATQTSDVQDEWIDVMSDQSFTHEAIFRTLRNHGYTGGNQIVQKHRREHGTR